MTESPQLMYCENKTTEDSDMYLFVCTGNTCRSPMAAALFNYLFGQTSKHALSAGIAADGSPISEYAVTSLMERGVLPTQDNDYIHHISRKVTSDLISCAKSVIAISGAHAMELMVRFPEHATKIGVMPKDITDPFGGTLDDYRKCLADIETSLSELFVNDTFPKNDGEYNENESSDNNTNFPFDDNRSGE